MPIEVGTNVGFKLAVPLFSCRTKKARAQMAISFNTQRRGKIRWRFRNLSQCPRHCLALWFPDIESSYRAHHLLGPVLRIFSPCRKWLWQEPPQKRRTDPEDVAKTDFE